MPRRKDDLASLLILTPWWVSVILAGLSYFVLKFVVPSVPTDNPVLQVLVRQAPDVAGFVALFFLFFAFVSFIRALSSSRLLEQQKDIDSLRTLHWKGFENLVAEYYRREGFRVQENLGGGADGGVDLVLNDDRDSRVVVQCKRWGKKPVPVQVIRELFGVMTAEKANRGVLMTTSTFTEDARRFAEGKAIELVEGEELMRRIRLVQKPSNHERPEVAEKPQPSVSQDKAPKCPKCGKAMIRRVAKKGPSAGQFFFGCSNYPACNGTRRDVQPADQSR